MRRVVLVLALTGCDRASAPAPAGDVRSSTSPTVAVQAEEGVAPTSPLAEPEVAAPSSSPEVTAAPARPHLVATATPTTDELLLLRDAGEAGWIGLLRTPAAPSYVYCDVLAPADLPRAHLDLIQGSIRQSTRRLDGWDERTCEVARVDARFDREAHRIRPLAAGHLGDLVLGLPRAEQAPWLAEADLERGPLRIFFGHESGLAVFASAYLEDLGAHFAIPTRPLLTIEELRVELDVRAAKQWTSRLGGAHHFAPQVADAATRIAFARTPVVLVADDLGSRRWAAPSAVPLAVGGARRFLMMQSYLMKSSWEAAFRRGRVIERIVDDGAMPP